MEYLSVVRELEAAGEQLAAGGAEERRAVQRFESLLSDFKAAGFRDRVREVYAEDVFFNDTLKTVRGLEELEEYLASSADAVDQCTVDFLDHLAAGGNHYFRWAMTIRFKRFASGEETRSIGMSHIRFDAEGRVVLHQDFWDSSAGLFEHVPGLGFLLRRAKSRL